MGPHQYFDQKDHLPSFLLPNYLRKKAGVNGFVHLIKQFPKEALFVVWLNPYWGEITMNGKQFEEMKAYVDNKARVSAIIRIPQYKPETFGKDLSEILQSKFTFDEALKNSALPVMVRQRLTIIRRQLFTNIENVAAVLT